MNGVDFEALSLIHWEKNRNRRWQPRAGGSSGGSGWMVRAYKRRKLNIEKKQEDGDGDHEHVHEEQLGVEALVKFDNLLKQNKAALKRQYSSLGRLFAQSYEIKITG